MRSLVERLRGPGATAELFGEAADRIERLEAENARRRDALLTLRDYLSDIAAGYLWAGDRDKLTRIQSESVEEDLARIDASISGEPQ